MSLSKLIANLVWMQTLILWVPATSTFLSSLDDQPSPAELPAVMALLPGVLITAGILWLRRDPFDLIALRTWVDKRLGDGAYAGFIRNAKPLLLFGTSSIAVGLVGFIQTFDANAPLDAYWHHGSMVSGGLGCHIARAMLARRGLSMDSDSTSS